MDWGEEEEGEHLELRPLETDGRVVRGGFQNPTPRSQRRSLWPSTRQDAARLVSYTSLSYHPLTPTLVTLAEDHRTIRSSFLIHMWSPRNIKQHKHLDARVSCEGGNWPYESTKGAFYDLFTHMPLYRTTQWGPNDHPYGQEGAPSQPSRWKSRGRIGLPMTTSGSIRMRAIADGIRWLKVLMSSHRTTSFTRLSRQGRRGSMVRDGPGGQ